MPVAARDLHLLEQAFLERQRPKLDRAEDHLRAAVGAPCAFALTLECRRVERNEVARCPVALEHSLELRQHGRVSGRRRTHVPLQPRHLRRVREVRRTDVGGGEPRVAMEHPRLRVQPCRRHVVRHPHLSTQIDELLDRSLLSGVGVGGGEHPHGLAAGAVPTERFQQRRDTATADEGHHHVDAIGRLDLRPQLAPQRRLPRRIREQGGIEHRDDRRFHPLGGAVGQTPHDRVQHHAGLHRRLITEVRHIVSACDLRKSIEQRPRHVEPDPNPIAITDIEQRPLDQPTEMPRDSVSCISARQRSLVERQLFGNPVEFCPQTHGDQLLVNPPPELRHEHRS